MSDPTSLHESWFHEQAHTLRAVLSYPFKGIGYTCDWSQGYCAYGFSEYIVRKNSEIKMKELLSNKEFFNQYMKGFSVIPEIENRFSVEKFTDTGLDISEPMYRLLFEAMRLSPSASNNQNWKFVVIKRGSSTFSDLMGPQVPHNRFILESSKVIIAFVSKKVSITERFNQYDIGIATGFLLIQAEHIGLKSHIIAGFEQKKVEEILKISDDYEVLTLVGLGY